MCDPEFLGRRVLVADDDEDLRDIVALALREDGYAVNTVSDGRKLVEWLDAALSFPSDMPDIIITDVVMPTLSGLGVLAALRRARMAMPVIVITGFADESVRTFARRLGAVALLKKPFEIDALLKAVAEAFSLQKRALES
jgi:DNA-binding response OmpR family regulator